MSSNQTVRATPETRPLLHALEMWHDTVTAGRRFDVALRRYVASTDNELSHAFAVALIDMDGNGNGRRRAALWRVAEQMGDPDVTQVIQRLLEADRNGTSIVETIEAEAARLRANGHEVDP